MIDYGISQGETIIESEDNYRIISGGSAGGNHKDLYIGSNNQYDRNKIIAVYFNSSKQAEKYCTEMVKLIKEVDNLDLTIIPEANQEEPIRIL